MEKCRYSARCGGCNSIGTEYRDTLTSKNAYMKKILGQFCRVEPIIGAEKPYFYRNKVNANFGRTKNGNILAGTYESNSHRIVDVEKCFLNNERADAIIRTIASLMKSFKYEPYNEDTGRGMVRHVLVRTAHATGEVMVTLVLGTNVFPSKNNFIRALLKECPYITTIVMNVNNRRTSMILGDREQTIYGRGYIVDELCGCRFKISPKSFYQVNSEQTEILYNIAMEYADIKGYEKIIDAYSGIGTIGIVAASMGAGEVVGIELNEDAVRDAMINIKYNDCKNIKYIQGDATDFIFKEAKKNSSYDIVFMDPPRSGSTNKFIDSVAKLAPSKVVYISCNPETLARDVKYFAHKGYKMIKCQPVDMFPWTEKVETVCLLSKLHEAKHHVRVKLDMDEMDLTSAESKATYEEIKKYVAEHNDGMKASSLNIAQVKAKYGIIERENYNKAKSEEARTYKRRTVRGDI